MIHTLSATVKIVRSVDSRDDGSAVQRAFVGYQSLERRLDGDTEYRDNRPEGNEMTVSHVNLRRIYEAKRRLTGLSCTTAA